MMFMVKPVQFWRIVLFVCFIAGISACAHVVVPAGGPKDITPPVYLKSEPAQGASGVSTRKFQLRFDEFVQLNDPFTKVIISPPVKEFPEFRTRGKNVFINFPKTLQSNRTYTIDFGDCIQDITENNPYSNFRYTFSTGAYVDSLSLVGFTLNAFSQEPEKSASVFLYSNNSDSIPYKEIPDFIARTRADGSFEFSNLPAGNYKIFVLQDKNANMLFDLPNESIAFLDSLVIPQYVPMPDTSKQSDSIVIDSIPAPVLKQYILRMFEETDTNQRLLKSQASQYGMFQLIFKWPVRDLQYRFLKNAQAPDWCINEYSNKRDTVSCWVTNIKLDSVYIEVSDQGIVVDTIELGLKRLADTTQPAKNRTGKGNSIKDLGFKLSILPNAGNGRNLDLNGVLKLRFQHPLKDYDLNRVVLKEMLDSIGKPLNAMMHFTDTGIYRNLEIAYKWKGNTAYRLEILPGVFQDMYGLKNDSLWLDFRTTQVDDYGVLKLNITLPTSAPCVFQLLTEGNAVVKEALITESQTLTYDYMTAGSYKARIIYDTNGNGKWDTGKYLSKMQPEKVVHYPRGISIKKNWDTEIDWQIK